MNNTTLLEKIINDLELTKKPENNFNCDKSMVAMDRHTGKVVVSQKTMQAYSESKGTRDHITVNACVFANGPVLPPHIIFAGIFPSGPYAREGPDRDCTQHQVMVMDSTLFYVFLDQLFIPKTKHIPGQKFLIFDNHGSHLDIELLGLQVLTNHICAFVTYSKS